MRRILFVVFSLLIIASFALTACGGAAETGGTEGGIKVVHLVNGVLGDKSFFDSAERGVRKAEAGR